MVKKQTILEVLNELEQKQKEVKSSKNVQFKEAVLDDWKASKIRDYRKLSGIDDATVITKDNIDDWALGAAAVRNACTRDDIKEAILTEDITLDATTKKAMSDIDASKIAAGSKTHIEQVLDSALEEARLQQATRGTNYPNILLIGEAGTGKSAITRQWARDNNINLFEVRAAGMDPTDLGGVPVPDKTGTRVVKLRTTELDKLDRPDSVLFLDEYNRAPASVRTNLLTLVQDHLIADSESDTGQKFFPNFLFTIAAINPPTNDYTVDQLDDAEVSRWHSIHVDLNPHEALNYLDKKYADQLAILNKDPERFATQIQKIAGRKGLADTLLLSPKFRFDTLEDKQKAKDSLGSDYKPLNYRTLDKVIDFTDGTKADLLRVWDTTCNPRKKEMVKDILNSYVDVKNKANDVLKTPSKSSVFKKTLSNLDKINQAYPDADFD